MFETSATFPPSAQAASPGEAIASRRPFPQEHEAEFAEVRAGVADKSFVMLAIGSALLFHVLLIAERALLNLRPSFFALRGAPVTLGLLALVLLPTSRAMRLYTRSLLCAVGWGAVASLVAGVNLAGAGELLPLQTGVAALVLLLGWAAQLPLAWTALLGGGMLVVDAVSLASTGTGSGALKLDSLFAPAFACAFTLLYAWVREQEARRDFIALRTAAFAGVAQEELPEESRHLDLVTGVGNREAFDMRLRAAWEHAASRRNSVALLMFSIDNFTHIKRDLGHRYGDMLQAQVAGMLKEGLRRSDDMVARYDVHHFVVMLPGVGTDGATQIAERLRGCIEELVIYQGADRHRATVTVGVASLRAKRSVAREKLIEAAAAALEQAKQTGTNVVCVEGRGCLPSMA